MSLCEAAQHDCNIVDFTVKHQTNIDIYLAWYARPRDLGNQDKEVFEPRHEKTVFRVCDQGRLKPACSHRS